MKWDNSLKTVSLKTEVRLMVKCCNRKKTKNKPESAMAYFLAIDDLINALIYFNLEKQN